MRTAGLLGAATAIAVSLPATGAFVDPDGAYTGSINGSPNVKVRHAVTNNGNWIRNFRTVIGAVCVRYPNIVVEPTYVGFPAARVNANNRYAGRWHPNDDIDLRFRGTQIGRRATGHVEGTTAGCTVKFDWDSAHN